MTGSLSDVARARRVGAATIAAIAIAIAGFVFLLDRTALGSPTHIRVTFRHTAGLREHAVLVIAGRAIGRVEAISPVPHGSGGTLGGDVGVALTVAIDEDSVWKVPARADIFISSRGPVSDKYLEIAPPTGDPGPAVHEGQELRGIDPPSLDGVLQRTWANLNTFRAFVAEVRPELNALRVQIDQLRAELDAIANQSRPSAGGDARASGSGSGSDTRAGSGDTRASSGDTRASSGDTRASGSGIDILVAATRELIAAARQTRDVSLGGEAGLAHLRATLVETRAMVTQLRATVESLAPKTAALRTDLLRIGGHLFASDPIARVEQTLASARTALDKLEPLLAGIDALRQQIAKGDGSLLRVIRDPEFPEDAKDLGKVIKRHPWRILEHARE